VSLKFTRLTGRTQDSTGYPLLVADGVDTASGERRCVSLHRLAAVAWGVLDGLDDSQEVHHRSGVQCETAEGVLEALSPEQHGSRSYAQAQREQRVRGDGGTSREVQT
jgi:hypothetical protein